MSILINLKKDHDKVREILKKASDLVGKYPNINEKEEKTLIRDLLKELEPHSKAEEKTFYSALRKKSVNTLIPYEGAEEHKLALQVLKSLHKGSLDKSQRSANIKVLKEMLLHHIEEEEATYFKEAKECFSSEELQMLGDKFLESKEKILNRKNY